MFKAELLFSLNCYAQNRIKDVLNHVKLRLMWRSNSKRMINNDWAIVLYSGKIQGMKVWLHNVCSIVHRLLNCSSFKISVSENSLEI
jgi:hypothetical protein